MDAALHGNIADRSGVSCRNVEALHGALCLADEPSLYQLIERELAKDRS
jgi:hypothetical protein